MSQSETCVSRHHGSWGRPGLGQLTAACHLALRDQQRGAVRSPAASPAQHMQLQLASSCEEELEEVWPGASVGWCSCCCPAAGWSGSDWGRAGGGWGHWAGGRRGWVEAAPAPPRQVTLPPPPQEPEIQSLLQFALVLAFSVSSGQFFRLVSKVLSLWNSLCWRRSNSSHFLQLS